MGAIEIVNGEASILHYPNGRYLFNSEEYQYDIKDHLGNSAVQFTDRNNDNIITSEASSDENNPCEVLQRNFYYAFGSSQEGWNPTNPINKIENTLVNNNLYNGKELHKDEDLGWYNYGARFFDPAIGRFTAQDPYADIFVNRTPYGYAGNNPTNNIDVNGQYIVVPNNKYAAKTWHDLAMIYATPRG